MRITPENITRLEHDEIIIVGTNQLGAYGAGLAKYCLDNFGAIYGQPVGLHGNCYGIPTKNLFMQTMRLEHIGNYVKNFIDFTKQNQDLTFYVTQIGCGLAGLTPEQVAPLFETCLGLENVYLPQSFIEVIKRGE